MLQRYSGSTAEQEQHYPCHHLEDRPGMEHAARPSAVSLATKKYYITRDFRSLALTHLAKRLILETILLKVLTKP